MTTIADQRAEILARLRAAATAELAPIHVHDTRPGYLSEGTTWIRWAGSGGRSDNGAPAWWFDRWHVFVVLYGDETVLEDWIDQYAGHIADALQRVAPVEAIEPADLTVTTTEGGTASVPALRFTCSRE